MVPKGFSVISRVRISASVAGAAILAAAAFSCTGTAFASTITGSFSSPPASANRHVTTSPTPVDISSGTSAWAYYGYSSNPNGSGTVAAALNTDSGNAASFSALSYTPNPSQTGFSSAGGYMELNFTGSSGASPNFVFDQAPNPGSSTNNFSFTTKMIASSETLNVFLISFDSKSNISATLSSGGSYTANGVVLPYSPPSDATGDGSGHGYGILSLHITGATIGDTLTFTDTNNLTGVSSSSYANVGIQAADVVVPEPATLGLMAVGGLGLLLLKRRRAV